MFQKSFSSRKPKPQGGRGRGPAGSSGGPGGGGDRKRFSGKGGMAGGPGGRFFAKKVCRFCADKVSVLDYKDTEKVKRFLTEKGRILPRRITGNCASCQRMLAVAIKRSRHAGLIAFQID